MKAKLSWADRVARMHPQHSRMEQDVLIALNKTNLHFFTDIAFELQTTTPDFYFPEKRLAVYLDGEKVHAKRQDKDSRIRELLAKRHKVKVVSITYKGYSKREKRRVLQKILEELG